MKPIPELNDEQKQRFWSNIKVLGPDDCWLWCLSTNNKGYGQVGFSRPGHRVPAMYLTHRVAWHLATGRQPTMRLLHSCDCRRCCNPNHVFLGTQLDNVHDMIAKGRDRKALGVDNGRAKLTPDKVRIIRASPLSAVELGRELGVTRHAIEDVRNGTTWKWLK